MATHAQRRRSDLEAAVKANRNRPARQNGEAGFSIMEVMISTFILMIGLLGVLGLFGLAIKANQTSQQDMIARQLASEAMESIFTARSTSQLTWAQIQNVGNGGIFLDNPQPLLCPGPDGLVGTGDDVPCTTSSGAVCPGGVQCLTEPGPDGILGTADDIVVSLANYTRQIRIIQMSDQAGNPIPTLNAVTITITYSTPQYATKKTYVLNEYISSYR
jgi:Tfp pilus assembly protein PilV